MFAHPPLAWAIRHPLAPRGYDAHVPPLLLLLVLGCLPHGPVAARPVDPALDQLETQAQLVFDGGEPDRAAELWIEACRRGHARSCHNAGWVIDGRGGRSEHLAVPWFRRACNGGDGRGCSMIGLKHEWGRGLPRAPVRARAYYKLGCDLGDANLGCFQQAVLLVTDAPESQDAWAEAMPLFERSCDAGRGAACLALAGALEGAEPETAARLRARGCQLEPDERCVPGG